MDFKWSSILLFITLSLISFLMHCHVFNLEIIGNHSIRQAQTQLNILNFHRYDDNILNPRTNVLDNNLEPSIRRYEFPIMQWSIAEVYAVTGESLTITRWIMFQQSID